jgi:putative glutathione S-transferase
MAHISDAQAELSERIYETVNNGVYRAGFADTQKAYETAYHMLFKTLDELEARLASAGPELDWAG